MSQSSVRVNIAITRIAKQHKTPSDSDNERILFGVRLDSGHISTEAAGAIALFHLKTRHQFKVFFTEDRNNTPDDFNWLRNIKHSQKLKIDVQIDVVSEKRVSAYIEFPDCRLVHVSSHDGGHTMTINTLKNAEMGILDDTAA